MDSKDRIAAILEVYEISAKSLSDRAGMDRPQAVYDILKGKTKSITEKMASKIISVFPDISLPWLMSGEGPMFREDVSCAGQSSKRIPLYDLAATAGFTSLYHDSPLSVEDFITIPHVQQVDGAIYARGDSMSPLISSGDIVIFKKVELIPHNIIWGSIYVISYSVDCDEYTVLKYIRRSPKDGYIRLESFNERYNSLDIPMSSITALAIVKASISFHTIG